MLVNRFERFSLDIFEVSRFWHKIADEEMALHGLKGPQAVYLTTLYHSPEGLTSAKLAEVCSRDKSDVSRAVAEFSQKGLLVKNSVNNKNTYRARLVLTDEGRKIAEHINDSAIKAVAGASQGLAEKEVEQFYRFFEHILENLRKIAKED